MHPLNTVARGAVTLGLATAGIAAAASTAPNSTTPATVHPATLLAPPVIEDNRGFGPAMWVQTSQPLIGDDDDQRVTISVAARGWHGSVPKDATVSVKSRGAWCTRFELRGGKSIPRGSAPFAVEVTTTARDGFTQRVLARAQSETSTGAATGGIPRVNSGCRRGILGSPG